MSNQNQKKPLSKKDFAQAIFTGLLIAILYTLVLILFFGEDGWIQFDADKVPISMLDSISSDCKELINEYLVFKNYIEDEGSIPDNADLQYEQKLKQNLQNEDCL